MNSQRGIRTLAWGALLLLLAACDGHDYDGGDIRTETRLVGQFDAIEMDGSARLEIAVGESESLTINGSDKSVEHTSTDVRGNTLHIKTSSKDWGWNGKRSRIIVKIGVPHLSALRLQGGNDVRLTGFKGGTTRVDVDGAARLHASGELDELTVEMEGAGFADLADLVATDAHVTVDGIGQVIVHPKETLDATMNGIGAIHYIGNPRQVNTHMNGLGTISQRDENNSERESRKEQRRLEKEQRKRDGDEWAEFGRPPQPDPESLQPEYDDPPQPDGSMTEVI